MVPRGDPAPSTPRGSEGLKDHLGPERAWVAVGLQLSANLRDQGFEGGLSPRVAWGIGACSDQSTWLRRGSCAWRARWLAAAGLSPNH